MYGAWMRNFGSVCFVYKRWLEDLKENYDKSKEVRRHHWQIWYECRHFYYTTHIYDVNLTIIYCIPFCESFIT